LVGSVAAVSDMLQEAKEWLSERFGRLEVLASHTEEVLTTALGLVQQELASIQEAREALNI
jgi:hypothetical protein